MIKHLVASAVFAGFGAGLFAAALQFVFVEPVLLEAELYESGVKIHVAGGGPQGHDHDHDHAVDTAPAAEPTVEGATVVAAEAEAEADHDHDHPAPADGFDLQRHALTVLFMAPVYTGYALVLVAAYAFAETKGARVSARAGIIWGMAGFIAVHLAPAAGLAPELPGMTAADLTPRQIWWVGTVIVTAIGLWGIAFGRDWKVWGGAVALLLAPHLIGAPQAEQVFGAVPPELAAQFAGRALAVGLAAWVTLGSLLGWFWQTNKA